MKHVFFWIKMKFDLTPRIAKYLIFGMFFMVLSVILSKTSDNVIFFIFSACFALLGLVLSMMGLINGCLDLARYLKNRLYGSKV